MIKKTLNFKNLDGKPVTKDFWFHLMPSEAIEIETSFKEGMEAHVLDIARREDKHAMILFFKDLIAKSYGERNPDGITFDKSDELSRRFTQTDAYSVLFFDLLGDAKHAIEFVKGVMPADIAQQIPDTLPVESLQEAVDNYVEPSAVETISPPARSLTEVAEATTEGSFENPIVDSVEDRPAYKRENRHASMAELRDMSPPEFQEAFAWKQAHPELKSGD